MKTYVRTFGDMTRQDIQEAGGKAANLGELTQKGFNVPPGFCVTSNSLDDLIERHNLTSTIDAIVATFDYKNIKALDEKTDQIRHLIINAEIPEDILRQITTAVAELNKPEEVFVAVRSSVAVKGTDISSFPGMMDTYHYLRGEEEIIHNIKKCWASLWTTRAVLTRHRKQIDHKLGLIAPIVQRMVHSEVAGVMFTGNPMTNNWDEIVIEANWGLGESVVSGKYNNDFYLLNKSSLLAKDKRISKKIATVSFDAEKGYGRTEIPVPSEKIECSTLSDDQLRHLGQIGLRIEEAFGFPQDIEFAYEKGELFILQSRKLRTLK